MSELKPCPFCGEPADDRYNRLAKCSNKKCLMNYWIEDDADFYIREGWNTRPIEDNLNARIAELEAEIERLSQLLHDEMSQLEIATDLGNKRWVALNKIYKDGEKHNTNWCKRIAQEGLGIKNA